MNLVDKLHIETVTSLERHYSSLKVETPVYEEKQHPSCQQGIDCVAIRHRKNSGLTSK